MKSRMSSIQRIGNYEVIDVLGHGGSSTIYAVQDLGSGQVFAIKHVIRKQSSDQCFIDQTLNEHEISNQFDHPILRKSYKMIRRRKILRVNELLVAYLDFAEAYYVKNGRPTGEFRNMKDAIRPLLGKRPREPFLTGRVSWRAC